MMNRYDIFGNWEYIDEYFAGFEHGEGEGTRVRLPHCRKSSGVCGENEKLASSVCGYRRRLDVPEYWEKQRVFITFDGVVSNAIIYINGVRVALRQSTRPRFTVEATDHLIYGSSNLLCVELDVSEGDDCALGSEGEKEMYRGVWIETTSNVFEESFINLVELSERKQVMVMPLC